MSNTQRPLNYLAKAHYFFPEIGENGHCFGHAHMGMQALLSKDLKTFTRRIESIYYGVPHPTQPKQRITVNDLKQIIKTEQLTTLEIATPIEIKSTIKTIEIKKLEDNKTETKENPLLKEINDALTKLKKHLNLATYIPPTDIKQIITHEAEDYLGNFPTDTPLISPEELKTQVDLALKIRSAYIAKIHKELENKNQMNKETRLVFQKKLAEFDKAYPYIGELIEIETYLTNLAIYHNPDKYPLLFTKENRPTYQIAKPVIPLLAPVLLDNKGETSIAKFNTFSNLYTYQKMQAYFDELAKALASCPDQLELPFALVLHSLSHVITIGYRPGNKTWILINANNPYPREIPQQHIAYEVFKNVTSLININITRANISAKLLYNRASKELIYVYTTYKNHSQILEPQPCSEEEKLPLALTTTDQLKKLSNFKLNITTDIYTTTQAQHLLNPMIEAWQTSLLKTSHQPDTLDIDDIYQQTLFKFVCYRGEMNTVQQLITQKANVNQIDSEGLTPLIMAASFGYHEIAILLLDNKADPNLASGSSPLIAASEHGSIAMVKTLIEAKANIHYAYPDTNQTALITAVYYGHNDIVDLLIKEGAIDARANVNLPGELPDGAANRKIFNTLFTSKVEPPPVKESKSSNKNTPKT